jgi:hypothetical protein
MPSMVVRIAGNVDELRANMAQGRSSVEATTAAVRKLGSGLDGSKIIGQANNIVQAVDRVGGATALTDREAKRLNRTLTEATEKYQRMGQTAPKAMTDLAEATSKANPVTSLLQKNLTGVQVAIGSFAGTFAATAVLGLARSFGNLIAEGAGIGAISNSFDKLTASIGVAGDEMVRVAQGATSGLISKLDLMQSANKAMLLGLPITANEFGALGQAAVALGRAMGSDATTALDDLIKALGRSSPLILDNLGLTVKVGEANAAYAVTLGKSASELTDVEKKMAFYHAAMAQAGVAVEALSGQELTLTEHTVQLSVAWENFAHAAGAALEQSGLSHVVDLATLSVDSLTTALAAAPAAYRAAADAAHGLETGLQTTTDQVLLLHKASIAARAIKPISMTAEEIDHISTRYQKWIDQLSESAAQLEANNRKIQSLQDGLTGEESIDRARTLLIALERLGNEGVAPMASQWDSIAKTTGEAMAVMEEYGNTGTELYARLTAAHRQFAGLTADGLIPTLPQDLKLLHAMATTALPSVSDAATQSAIAMIRMENAVAADAEALESMAEAADFSMAVVGTMPQGNAAAASSFDALAASMQRTISAAVDLATVDLDNAYSQAGFIAHGSLSGIRPTRAPQANAPLPAGLPSGGRFGGAVTVNVDARDSFYDTPSGVSKLAEKVGQSVVSQMRGRGVGL